MSGLVVEYKETPLIGLPVTKYSGLVRANDKFYLTNGAMTPESFNTSASANFNCGLVNNISIVGLNNTTFGHIGNDDIHRKIVDGSVLPTDLWSGFKIDDSISTIETNLNAFLSSQNTVNTNQQVAINQNISDLSTQDGRINTNATNLTNYTLVQAGKDQTQDTDITQNASNLTDYQTAQATTDQTQDTAIALNASNLTDYQTAQSTLNTDQDTAITQNANNLTNYQTTQAGVDLAQELLITQNTTHRNDQTLHRTIKDSGTTDTDLWSADKIQSKLDAQTHTVSDITDFTTGVASENLTQITTALVQDSTSNTKIELNNELILNSEVVKIKGYQISSGTENYQPLWSGDPTRFGPSSEISRVNSNQDIEYPDNKSYRVAIGDATQDFELGDYREINYEVSSANNRLIFIGICRTDITTQWGASNTPNQTALNSLGITNTYIAGLYGYNNPQAGDDLAGLFVDFGIEPRATSLIMNTAGESALKNEDQIRIKVNENGLVEFSQISATTPWVNSWTAQLLANKVYNIITFDNSGVQSSGRVNMLTSVRNSLVGGQNPVDVMTVSNGAVGITGTLTCADIDSTDIDAVNIITSTVSAVTVNATNVNAGNLTVSGTTTTLNTTQVVVEDPLIKLANGNIGDNANIGVYGETNSLGTPNYRGLVNRSGTWYLFDDVGTEPTLLNDEFTTSSAELDVGSVRCDSITPRGSNIDMSMSSGGAQVIVNSIAGLILTSNSGMNITASQDIFMNTSTLNTAVDTSTVTGSTFVSSFVGANGIVLNQTNAVIFAPNVVLNPANDLLVNTVIQDVAKDAWGQAYAKYSSANPKVITAIAAGDWDSAFTIPAPATAGLNIGWTLPEEFKIIIPGTYEISYNITAATIDEKKSELDYILTKNGVDIFPSSSLRVGEKGKFKCNTGRCIIVGAVDDLFRFRIKFSEAEVVQVLNFYINIKRLRTNN